MSFTGPVHTWSHYLNPNVFGADKLHWVAAHLGYVRSLKLKVRSTPRAEICRKELILSDFITSLAVPDLEGLVSEFRSCNSGFLWKSEFMLRRARELRFWVYEEYRDHFSSYKV